MVVHDGKVFATYIQFLLLDYLEVEFKFLAFGNINESILTCMGLGLGCIALLPCD